MNSAGAPSMIFRFSLYGLLKNQRYFEPFLILVFLEKGLTFFQIGLLVAFREVAINLFEIPSGAVADLWGRRRAMIVSFSAYIASFVIFALARDLPMLFAGHVSLRHRGGVPFGYAQGDDLRLVAIE